MRNPGGVYDSRDFQHESLRIDPVEQPHTATEQQGGEVDLDLVDQPGFEELLDDVRAARDSNVPIVRGLLRLLQGALEAVCDERECRASLPGPRVPRMVGEDEHRCAKRGEDPAIPLPLRRTCADP
jgi:hypothetical protein